MSGIWAGCKGRLDWFAGHARRLSRFRRWCVILAAGLVVSAGVALSLTWDDIMKTGIDPKEPFQTYRRRMPKAPEKNGNGNAPFVSDQSLGGMQPGWLYGAGDARRPAGAAAGY